MSKRGFLSCLVAALTLSLFISVSPAMSIYGGTPAIGNKVVVALLRSEMATNSGCSGGLVAPRVVMTAAHCMTSTPNNYWIAEPGSDVRDLSTKRIQAEKIYLPEGFTATKFPYQNDFAIIVLKSGFENYETLEIATNEQVLKWMSEESIVTHIGYGCTVLVDVPPCAPTSPTPNQLETTFSKIIPQQFSALVPNTFSATKISVEKTICGGDSGSPLLKQVDGKWIYVGAQSSSNGAGCTKTCNIFCAATQGLPAVNTPLVEAALKFVASTTPTPAPTPSSTPTVIVTAAPLAKKITITCVKGKLVKKVTAVKPVCPKGYKKR